MVGVREKFPLGSSLTVIYLQIIRYLGMWATPHCIPLYELWQPWVVQTELLKLENLSLRAILHN